MTVFISLGFPLMNLLTITTGGETRLLLCIEPLCISGNISFCSSSSALATDMSLCYFRFLLPSKLQLVLPLVRLTLTRFFGSSTLLFDIRLYCGSMSYTLIITADHPSLYGLAWLFIGHDCLIDYFLLIHELWLVLVLQQSWCLTLELASPSVQRWFTFILRRDFGFFLLRNIICLLRDIWAFNSLKIYYLAWYRPTLPAISTCLHERLHVVPSLGEGPNEQIVLLLE